MGTYFTEGYMRLSPNQGCLGTPNNVEYRVLGSMGHPYSEKLPYRDHPWVALSSKMKVARLQDWDWVSGLFS